MVLITICQITIIVCLTQLIKITSKHTTKVVQIHWVTTIITVEETAILIKATCTMDLRTQKNMTAQQVQHVSISLFRNTGQVTPEVTINVQNSLFFFLLPKSFSRPSRLYFA